MKEYSIPIYENGIKTEWTVDFIEGDDRYNTLMKMHNEIPTMININTIIDIQQ